MFCLAFLDGVMVPGRIASTFRFHFCSLLMRTKRMFSLIFHPYQMWCHAQMTLHVPYQTHFATTLLAVQSVTATMASVWMLVAYVFSVSETDFGRPSKFSYFHFLESMK